MEIAKLEFKKKFLLCKKKLWTINSTAGKTFNRFWAATTENFDFFFFLFSEK